MQHTSLPPKIYFRSYPTPPFFPVYMHIYTFHPSVCHRLLSYPRLSCAHTRSLSYSPALPYSHLVAPVIALSLVEILLPPRLCHHTTAYMCTYVCVCVCMCACSGVCVHMFVSLKRLHHLSLGRNNHTPNTTDTTTRTHN